MAVVEIKNVKVEKGIIYFITEKNQVAKIDFNNSKVYGVSGKELRTIPNYMDCKLLKFVNNNNDNKINTFLEIADSAIYSGNYIKTVCFNLLTLDKLINLNCLPKQFIKKSISCQIDFSLLSKIIKWLKETENLRMLDLCVNYPKLVEEYYRSIMRYEFDNIVDKSLYKDLISQDNKNKIYNNYYISDRDVYSIINNTKIFGKIGELTKKHLNLILYWTAHEEFFGWVGDIFRSKKNIRNLFHYFEVCEALEIEPEKKNPCKHICQMEKAYEDIKNKEQDKILLEKYNENFKRFFYENDKYTVIMPKTTKEFITEGDNLNNCLGWNNYAGKVASGERIVLFVRKKENIDKSYIAMDLYYSHNMHGWYINQYFTYNNSSPSDLSFRHEYNIFLENFVNK